MLRLAWTGEPALFLVPNTERRLLLPSFSPPPRSSLTPCSPAQLANHLAALAADLHFVQSNDTREFGAYLMGIRYASDLAHGSDYVHRYFHTDLAILPNGAYLQLVLLPQYGPGDGPPRRVEAQR